MMTALSLLILLSGFNLISGRKIIIDTDAGVDDAFAIYLTLNSDNGKEVESIVSVSGNTAEENVIQNVLKTLGTANFTVPLYRGSNASLSGIVQSDNYFGLDGFGDFKYDGRIDGNLLQQKDGVDYLIDIVKENPGEVTILCIGPLTNIARATMKFPRFLENIKSLVVLGGNRGVTKEVEFNMMIDPIAANFVFERISHLNKVMTLIPKETFHVLALSSEFRKNVISTIDTDIVSLLNNAERISLINATMWNIADQTAALSLVYPEIIKSKYLGQPSLDEVGIMTIKEGNSTWIVSEFKSELVIQRIINSLKNCCRK